MQQVVQLNKKGFSIRFTTVTVRAHEGRAQARSFLPKRKASSDAIPLTNVIDHEVVLQNTQAPSVSSPDNCVMPFTFFLYSLTVCFVLFELTADTTNSNQKQQQTGRECRRYSRKEP